MLCYPLNSCSRSKRTRRTTTWSSNRKEAPVEVNWAITKQRPTKLKTTMVTCSWCKIEVYLGTTGDLRRTWQKIRYNNLKFSLSKSNPIFNKWLTLLSTLAETLWAWGDTPSSWPKLEQEVYPRQMHSLVEISIIKGRLVLICQAYSNTQLLPNLDLRKIDKIWVNKQSSII